MISVEYKNEIDCGELGTIKSKVDLSALEKDISALAQKNNVPIKIRNDKYKIGKGLFSIASEALPCIVVSNANHSKGYYEYVIGASFSSGVTHIKIFSTGISNNKGIVAVYGQNKGSILSSVIANSAQKKLNEENIYYEKLLDIFAVALENADLQDTIEIVRKYDFDIENVDQIFNKLPFSKICRAREIIYSDSVEKHDVQGMLKLSHAYTYLDRPNDAFQVLDILVKENNSEAMFWMARIYSGNVESGPNIERLKNDHKRLYWLKRAVFAGNTKAANELGDFYRFDNPDYDKAYYWYTVAAKAGSAKGYYNRGQLLEKDLRVSKIDDSIRGEIANKVERDYHYAFELVREINLQANIAGDLGHFYKWGVMSSIYGRYIINPNPLLALYFYYVAMDCSKSNGFFSETYNELSNELGRQLNDDTFAEVRDGILTPYMEEKEFFYPAEGSIPEEDGRNLERIYEDAKNGNSESIKRVIEILCFDFSTYKAAEEWVDFYIGVDKVSGLITAGKVYFEYAPFSGDAKKYFSKATECLLEAYELSSDLRLKKEASQILADIYSCYYCDDEKAKNYIVDVADESKNQHIITSESHNSGESDRIVKKNKFGLIIAVMIIAVIMFVLVIQYNNRKIANSSLPNKADSYESNTKGGLDSFTDSYELYAEGNNNVFKIDEELALLYEAGIYDKELIYANPVFYGKSDEEREEMLGNILNLKPLKSIICTSTYGPNNYKYIEEKNYDTDSKLTSICLYDNGEKYSETQYMYDKQSRLIEKRYYDFGDLLYKDSYEYDSEGKLITCVNGFEDYCENYTYNDSGILVEKNSIWDIGQEYHYLYYYDDKGRRIAVEGYDEDDLIYNEETVYDDRYISRNYYYSEGSEQKIEEFYNEEGTISKIEELYIDMGLGTETHSITTYAYNDFGRLIEYSHVYKVQDDYDSDDINEFFNTIDCDYNDEGKLIGYSRGESKYIVEYMENGQIQRVYCVDADIEYVFNYY